MVLTKTDKARAELRPGVRTLGQRERTVLLMADGTRTAADLSALFAGEGTRIAASLVADGYLVEQAVIPPPSVRDSSPSRHSHDSRDSHPAPAAPVVPAGSSASPAKSPPTEALAVNASASADPFQGKRSLATTRMFLFDLCERMFARRDPARAGTFREALREARDRESMMAAAREMIAEIERVAGAERADSISERIAMLLPPETV